MTIEAPLSALLKIMLNTGGKISVETYISTKASLPVAHNQMLHRLGAAHLRHNYPVEDIHLISEIFKSVLFQEGISLLGR